MRLGPDLVIVHSPVGGGHTSAARAAAEAARAQGRSVVVLNAFDYAPPLFGKVYVGAHLTGQRVLPHLYGPLYFAANHRGGPFSPVRRGFDHVAFAPLVDHVTALSPRAVIATHHLPLVALGRARRTGRLEAPLVGVVTDYTSHAVWAEKGVDAFAVACPEARDELVAHGVVPSRIHVTGIPVRRAFFEIPDVRPPSPGKPLRVLLTSGGLGVGPLRKVVARLARADGIELTVVCGSSQSLVRSVTRDLERIGGRARVLGFERDMAARLSEAHVVVGKSGGLTVTETLAAGRPMVVVGAIPGNETENERYVVEAGAGLSASPDEVETALSRIRARGGDAVAKMGECARRLVPSYSADRLVAWTEGWAEAFAGPLAA